MPNTGNILATAVAQAADILGQALDGAITGTAGAKGEPGGVDAATAAVINETQAALATKQDVPVTQVFTTSGTWTRPANATRVRIRVQGGGGGGGGGPSVASGTTCSGGAGGGGGAVLECEFAASDLAATVAVTVGSGGVGGQGGGSAGAVGGSGGNSAFGSYLVAGGGGGGGGGAASANSGGGGAGGLTLAGSGSSTGGFGGTGAAAGGTGVAGGVGAVGGSSGSGCASTGLAAAGFPAGVGGGAGGGAGGGITSGNAAQTGAAGGRSMASPAEGGAAGSGGGGGGGTLANAYGSMPGAGGGGGGGNVGGPGGSGGAGQSAGGGGGGGGAARSGFAGGNGGAGGTGLVTVTTWAASPATLPAVVSGGGVATLRQSATSLPAPVYGSAKFPDFNGQFAGAYGVIVQPTDGFGNWFGGDGCLFMELEIPQERMLEPRQFNVFGNGFTGGTAIGLTYYGNSYPITPARRNCFALYLANSSGQSVTLVSPAIPVSVVRVLVYAVRTVNACSLKVLDLDSGTLYAGNPVDVSAFSGIATFAGSQVLIGDISTTAAERTSWNGTASAWTGSIGRIGYVDASVGDAVMAGLRTGTDPVTQFGAWTRWYRALDGGPSSLLRQAAATGDSTGAAVAHGVISPGGFLHANCSVQLARIADGAVFPCLPGERFARVRLPFTVRNVGAAGDIVEIRIIGRGGVPVLSWSPGAVVAAGQSGGVAEVTCPLDAGWLMAEARLRSAPEAINLAPGLFGVGAGCGLLGQSQIANGMGRAGIGNRYDGRTAASLAWTISSQGVKGAVLWRLDQGKVVSDLLVAACQQAARVYPGAQGWIVDAVGGTGLNQLIDDSQSARAWTQWAGTVAVSKGLSTILLPWFTALNSLAATVSIANQLDGGLRGRGPAASDHFLYEAGFLPAAGTVVVYPGTRHNVPGSLGGDSAVSTYGNARDAMRNWVAAQQMAGNANFLIGPEQIVTTVDNYHPANDAAGDVRLGYSLGVGLGIGMRTFALAEAFVDGASFAFTDAGRTAFTFEVVTPGNAPICNFMGATWASGADKGVMGVQVSSDGGSTWTYLPASACQITGRFRVTCTKPSGAWGAGLKAQVMSGGPMAYGTSNPDSGTAAANYGIGDNDARMLTGFGNPIRSANSVYSVAG